MMDRDRLQAFMRLGARYDANDAEARKALTSRVVWRGQRRADRLETRLPGICFGEQGTAAIYAVHPNDRTAVETSNAPVVIPAVLHPRRVFSPFAPGDFDPFLDIEDADLLFGRDVARRLVADLAGPLRDTNAWHELVEQHGYVTPLEAFDDWPQACPFLPPALMHEVLRLPWFVDLLRAKGYDAARTGGSGDNAMEDEWHVFDETIVEWGFGAARRQARRAEMMEGFLADLRDAPEVRDPGQAAPDLEFVQDAEENDAALAWRLLDIPLDLLLRSDERQGQVLPSEAEHEARDRWEGTRRWIEDKGVDAALAQCPVVVRLDEADLGLVDGWHRCLLLRDHFGQDRVRALVRVDSWPEPECCPHEKGPGNDPGPGV